MRCPACGDELREMSVAGIALDVCDGGCGGIWFDAHELEKLDEPHEEAGTRLLELERDPGASRPPPDAELRCPRCREDPVLHRHFFSVERGVEVDECPVCAGVWLDYGELGEIRSLFPSEEARREAAEEYFEELFGDELDEMRAESEERLARARRIARIFRFICPSYYIPGDQPWGAY